MPPQPSQPEDDQAHDVLAAEAFGMPAPDPALHRDDAHDVLAAEEFIVPAPDPGLHHRGPVMLPSDPSGIAEPHDVLAAEEFAMPTGRPPVTGLPGARGTASGRGRVLAAVGALVFVALRRRSRRA